MKLFAPDYYKKFKCIADKCRHNCCIGWEIDIDEDTWAYYREIEDGFGERLKNGICEKSDAPHFILTENERCPFLNDNNLCDIILNLGEEGLCQICSDHPRFRNFFSDREEIGLGLCCEAACELILTNESKVKIIEIADDGQEEFEDPDEKEFFAFREKLFEIIQNRGKDIDERVSDMLDFCGAVFPEKSEAEWAEVLRRFERLDCSWDKMLDRLAEEGKKEYNEKWDTAYEQLIVYFIYRQLSESVYDGRLKERICFAVLSCYIIRRIFETYENGGVCELCDIARAYSSEIEYSDENTQKLLDILKA